MRWLGGASGEVRIGEVATWAGVTPRTVRHYHRIGLLPEPPRSSNGYRDYGMADLVRLLRVRRLAELGVRLDDVKDVVSGAGPLALPDMLDELERHLSAQEQRIAEQRAEIKRLRHDADNPDHLREVLASIAASSPVDDSDVTVESWLLAGVGSLVGQSPAQVGAAVTDALGGDALGSDESLSRVGEFVRRFALLEDADPTSVEVERLAAEISGSQLVDTPRDGAAVTSAPPLIRALHSQLSAAQARCLELMLDALRTQT